MSRNVYSYECIEKINNEFLVSDDTEIFRYMNYNRYIDLLESKELFFCNIYEYEDAFEGERPEGFYNNWTQEMIDGHKRIARVKDKTFNSYVSCWNMRSDECYGFWNTYTDSLTGKGVAIKSTVGDLRRALDNDSIDTYKVKYIESFEDQKINIEPPFKMKATSFTRVKEVYKSSSYSYENEFRAIYESRINKKGIRFEVDLSKLINEVYVSPYASEKFYALVKEVSSRPEYLIEDNKIKKSKIKLKK